MPRFSAGEREIIRQRLMREGERLFAAFGVKKVTVDEIVRATGANYGRMVELVNPYNKALAMPWVTGGWDFDTVQGLARLSKEINRQAAMLGYINAFGFYTLCSALAIPLILLIGRRARAS